MCACVGGGSDLDSHLGKRKEASGHLRYVVIVQV